MYTRTNTTLRQILYILIIFNKHCSPSLASHQVLRDIFKKRNELESIAIVYLLQALIYEGPRVRITIPISTSFGRPDGLRKGIKTLMIIGRARQFPPTLVSPSHARSELKRPTPTNEFLTSIRLLLRAVKESRIVVRVGLL